MNEYDLLKAIGDINEKYIENAVVEEGTKVDFAKAIPDVPARGRRKELIYIAVKRRKIQRMIVVATVLIIFVSAGVFVYWLLQREKGSTVDDGKTRGDHYSVSFQLTGVVEPDNTPIPVEESPVCATYQFMNLRETEYNASFESCDRIGAEIGIARVRNEHEESETTLFKDVVVYEIDGMDSAIAVLVYYPEEQEYYVYYNANY